MQNIVLFVGMRYVRPYGIPTNIWHDTTVTGPKMAKNIKPKTYLGTN